MGGPMNVYEDKKYPFLREESNFLKQAIDDGVPVLGICLGAQMIARACGASVVKASQKEVGWSKVFLTDMGKEDMLFRGLSETLPVFQWHEDTFELPVGGQLLATSTTCPHQSFRYSNAYGLQFHVEVTPQIISAWFGSSSEGEQMIRQFEKIEVDFIRHALILYHNFFDGLKCTRC
jgi:GMP synthase-like glutamine amidotransferase